SPTRSPPKPQQRPTPSRKVRWYVRVRESVRPRTAGPDRPRPPPLRRGETDPRRRPRGGREARPPRGRGRVGEERVPGARAREGARGARVLPDAARHRVVPRAELG